jgi:hypothetical protein
MLRIFIRNMLSYTREAAADFSIAKLSAKFSLAKRSGKTQVSANRTLNTLYEHGQSN